MSEKRKKFRIPTVVKGMGSLILLAAILVFGGIAVKFCLGLFVVGDYVVTLPGEKSPVIQVSNQTAVATAPVGSQSDFVMEVSRGTVTITGDVMLHMPIVNSVNASGSYDFSEVFRYIAPRVTSANYAVANLETTLSGTDSKEYTGYPNFNSPDSIASALQSSGFDMLLTANNHCYDYGTQGLKRTLEVVSGQSLATLGTVSSAGTPNHTVKDVNGIKIGMVCYTYGVIGDDPTRPTINGMTTDAAAAGLINAFDYDHLDRFYEEIAAHMEAMAAKGAEAYVVYIHWGEEYQTQQNGQQQAIAQKLCDLGVDVIAGSHPHVVEPMELLTSTMDSGHKTVCLYSMGNFLSNQRASNTDALPTGHTEDSLLLTLTFVKYTDGKVYLENAEILPTWVRVEGSGSNRKYTIIPLDGNPESWSTSYGLTAEHLEEAKNSLGRTMELVQSGLSEVKAYLTEEKAARLPFISVG